MAPWLRTLSVLAEDLSEFSSLPLCQGTRKHQSLHSVLTSPSPISQTSRNKNKSKNITIAGWHWGKVNIRQALLTMPGYQSPQNEISSIPHAKGAYRNHLYGLATQVPLFFSVLSSPQYVRPEFAFPQQNVSDRIRKWLGRPSRESFLHAMYMSVNWNRSVSVMLWRGGRGRGSSPI